MDAQESGVVDLPRRHTLKRKPVPGAQTHDHWVGLPPALDKTVIDTGGPSPVKNDVAPLDDGIQDLRIDTNVHDEIPPSADDPLSHTNTALTGLTLVASESVSDGGPTPVEDKPAGPSKLAKAWEETKYFAGGLMPHPAESTRHYSVLRHSLGVVYYQGPATSIAISIFADRLLPPDRKIWLQQKGWTGAAGWAAKQLFRANGGWLDVTPSVEALPEQLPKSCERAWQRDCKKFIKNEGGKRNHWLRETCIVRIPCEAEDGYFRLVVCGEGKPKNKLCPSPVFRVASTNSSPSSMKGSSLSTLPLEAGIKVLSMVANNAAMNAVAPMTNAVTSTVGKYMPGFWAQEAASTAYSTTGIQSKIDNANETYQSVRDASYQHVGGVDERVYEALDRAPMVGHESGPQAPFPIRVSSTIVPGTGLSSQKRGIATANLSYVREEVTMSMHGIYFGWARISPSKQLLKGLTPELQGFYPTWHPTIIDVSIVPNAPVNVTYGAKKQVCVHLIHSFGDLAMTGSGIEAVVMGFLREHVPPSKVLDEAEAERRAEQDGNDVIADIAITQASLARPAWAIERAYQIRGWKAERGEVDEDTGKIKKLTQSMTERYVDARQAAQRQVDRMPVHRMGVRRNVDNLKSQAIGTGGIYIRR